MSQLLVSVRTASEAALARLGGASLIDVKEPSRGPLGRADDATLTAVLNQVGGVCPVSAALGELRDFTVLPWGWERLAFVKWGLSGCAGKDWSGVLRRRAERPGSRVVVVAYADAEVAQAPPVPEVVAFACGRPWPDPVLLIDTFDKSPAEGGRRRHLLDWLTLDELVNVRSTCRDRGVRLALAGSLGAEQIAALLPVEPDWFAVRGAVCAGNERDQCLSLARLSELVKLLEANRSSSSRRPRES
jgi:(5-formylfuran-3-yl)methyl phosphate synthase